MGSIFLIEKTSLINLGNIGFLPRKDERIILRTKNGKNGECIVDCVVYDPMNNATLIFVDVFINEYYEGKIKDIKW